MCLLKTKFFTFRVSPSVHTSVKFVIMIRCKINFDIIWYSVIFAANLYLSKFVWSSDILNFFFKNVVILVINKNFPFLLLNTQSRLYIIPNLLAANVVYNIWGQYHLQLLFPFYLNILKIGTSFYHIELPLTFKILLLNFFFFNSIKYIINLIFTVKDI